MNTKTYLNQISRLDLMIKNKISELSSLRALCYGLSAVSTEEKVQTTPNHDKIGTIVAKLDELERETDKLVDEYADKRKKIISQIDSISDPVLYNILFARYIEQKTFERIAADMDYCFRQITRLHGKALIEFEKKYGHQYLNDVLECPIDGML